jgi:hypothetical protein
MADMGRCGRTASQRIALDLLTAYLSLGTIAGLQLLFFGVQFESPYFPILQQTPAFSCRPAKREMSRMNDEVARVQVAYLDIR